MELSIVLGTMDRPKEFLGLYDSIIKHTQGISWELVVSDAAQITPLEPGLFPSARIIPENPRLGHVKGYNRLFREAKGEYVLWLNDDCVVTPDWAKNALAFMRSREDVGLGALFYCVWDPPFFCNSWLGDLPYANFGIINREYGNRLGWFDDEMYFYGADNSLAFKVFLSGKLVRGIPNSRVIHRPFLDIHRPGNERHQPSDAAIVRNKYEHLVDAMVRVHRAGRQD